MKSPSFSEFQTIIQFIHEELLGAQLQEISSSDEGLVLGFYRYTKEPKTCWLVFDLDTQYPFLGLYFENPWPKLKKTKPMALFLNSNFKNLKLVDIHIIENFGRVAQFHFSHSEQFILDLRLIPKQPNLLAQAGPKKMSWHKVKDLEPINDIVHQNYENEELRSIHYMFKQWFERRSQNILTEGMSQKSSIANEKFKVDQSSPFEKWLQNKNKDLKKKEKAIELITQQNHKYLEIPWAEIGEYLKQHGFKNLPVEWSAYVDFEKKVSYSITKCFEKVKQIKTKISGSAERVQILKGEILKLQNLTEDDYLKELNLKNQKNLKIGQRKSLKAEFRKLALDDSDSLHVYMGKSALDNINLLKQSKAWDLWLHLKDYPSAHAIIQKNRDQVISDKELIKAAQWLIKESMKSKKMQDKALDGQKVNVVVVACRFVKPVKGDKIGRVTYHNPRELLVSI